MPSLTLSDRLIWFAHCPKAGGTSIEQFMVARWGDRVGHLHWGWDLWWRQGGWRVADPPNSPQHLIWADAIGRLPRPPDTVFAVVRDPVARMQSEHRWQRHGRRGTQAGKALAWLPFSVWLHVMVAVLARHSNAFDNHLRPQADFIPQTARVFYLENGLDHVTRWLAETTGEKVSIPTPHAIPTRSGQSSMTDSDAALIATVFAADYQRFGYARPRATSARLPLRNYLQGGLINVLANGLAPLVCWLDRRGHL